MGLCGLRDLCIEAEASGQSIAERAMRPESTAGLSRNPKRKINLKVGPEIKRRARQNRYSTILGGPVSSPSLDAVAARGRQVMEAAIHWRVDGHPPFARSRQGRHALHFAHEIENYISRRLG
ncbi:hypothetical protein GCM10010994_04140 [Chelatococcus reniformis]|uniref:Uncharacterized protein n=1 Tax=Chelatococcus reniformis TaxID=1494448 RepID=A0A916TWS5_9HYPH|nr:hypothetical protein GCM10010994_04140 [Chelatococcus reniformis]